MTAGKAELRKLLRQQPASGDSGALCRRILDSGWFQRAETVLAYCAIAPEPDLEMVLEAALSQGKTLLLPRCEPDGTMTARWVRDLGELQKGAYGIREPGAGLPVFPPERIQLILTPGMAFDRRGGRLGRGKGYYDRFLAQAGGMTVGVCFGARLLDLVPMEPHDHRMDAVVTELETILCEMEGDGCLGKNVT